MHLDDRRAPTARIRRNVLSTGEAGGEEFRAALADHLKRSRPMRTPSGPRGRAVPAALTAVITAAALLAGAPAAGAGVSTGRNAV
ncbi:hypothetical protein AB0J28_48060, partial [Streptosporangium canum]|uniref:hypothetical protein n=1 Tax=Streptosporangium canum TaxID=324952 RepID=UPI00343E8259